MKDRSLTSRFDLAPRRACLISLQQLEETSSSSSCQLDESRLKSQSSVLPFCCAGPQLSLDGRYPLRCSLVSGLSSTGLSQQRLSLRTFPGGIYRRSSGGFPQELVVRENTWTSSLKLGKIGHGHSLSISVSHGSRGESF